MQFRETRQLLPRDQRVERLEYRKFYSSDRPKSRAREHSAPQNSRRSNSRVHHGKRSSTHRDSHRRRDRSPIRDNVARGRPTSRRNSTSRRSDQSTNSTSRRRNRSRTRLDRRDSPSRLHDRNRAEKAKLDAELDDLQQERAIGNVALPRYFTPLIKWITRNSEVWICTVWLCRGGGGVCGQTK